MKKISIIAFLVSIAALTSCGRDADKPASTVSEKATATAAETTTDTTTSTTATAVSTTKKTESTTSAETTAAGSEKAENYAGIAGYWYIDGDPGAASLHITEDGKFAAYYASGLLENKGYIKRELDTEINNYVYCMYLDSGELYMAFADDGEEFKTDIYMGNGGEPHYAKLYGEGGIGDDGRGPEEAYEGKWQCERARLSIEDRGEGIFHALITWSDSAASYAEWDYPLIFDTDRLICDGNGTLTYVEYKEAGAEPERTVEYTDGSAEFTLEGNSIRWNDKKEHSGDNIIFRRNTHEE